MIQYNTYIVTAEAEVLFMRTVKQGVSVLFFSLTDFYLFSVILCDVSQDHSQYALTYGLMLGIRVMVRDTQ